jgi:hypothetical protein
LTIFLSFLLYKWNSLIFIFAVYFDGICCLNSLLFKWTHYIGTNDVSKPIQPWYSWNIVESVVKHHKPNRNQNVYPVHVSCSSSFLFLITYNWELQKLININEFHLYSKKETKIVKIV